MKDKVQKIREELARLQKRAEHNLDTSLTENERQFWLGESNVLTLIGKYIDSLQEETMPKFKAGDHIRPIDSSLGVPRTILEVCDGWYVTDQGTLDFEFEDNWELVEEPAGLDKGKLMDMLEDSLSKETKESWNERLDEASKEWLRPQLDKSYAAYGETKQMELTHFDGYAMLDAIEFGAKWKNEQIMANTTDAMICLPYENKDGGYTHLIDVSRPLPVGDNKIAIIFKED